MEERVGALWHRFVTRAAQRHDPKVAVALADIEKTAGLLFRAFGGDPGLRIASAITVRHGARRGWLARIAGVGDKAELASRDLDGIPEIKQLRQRLDDGIQTVRDATVRAAQQAADQARDAARAADRYAHDEPWRVASAALAVGALVGFLLARR